MMQKKSYIPYLQVAPLAAVFAGFLVIPILTIIVVSFWDYNFVSIIPDFIFTNYRELLGSEVTLQTYLNTLRYAVMAWALTRSEEHTSELQSLMSISYAVFCL